MKKLWPVLGALLLLGGAGILARQMAEAGGMERPMTQILQFEQWLNPASGERVSLRFDGQKTTVQRGAAVSEHQNPAFDMAAEKAKLQAQTQNTWNPMFVQMWRMMLIERQGSREAARREFLHLGFPPKLWDELDAFDKQMNGGASEKPNQIPEAYHSSLTITAADPYSLLFNPPTDLRRRFAEIWANEMQISPPQPVASLDEQSTQLARAGFIRLSPRRPDGSLWLPPALEKYRNDVLKLERPVVRPFVKAGKPAPWDSKFGGIPYRPKGAAWPVGRSGEPMSFLAQIDLSVANKDGVLSDLPRRGLLQFFAADPSLDYQESKVMYWPDILHDPAALTTQILTSNSDDLLFTPPEHAMDFMTDTEIPSSLDALMQFAEPKGAETGVGEPYQQAENNTKVMPNGHRLRGYPMVINAYFDPKEDWRLLFQFDGDDYGGQLYGENGGMGGWLGFFVHGSDLKKLDFGRVRLEMDAF